MQFEKEIKLIEINMNENWPFLRIFIIFIKILYNPIGFILEKKLELEGLLGFRLLTFLSLIDIVLDTLLQVFSISPVKKKHRARCDWYWIDATQITNRCFRTFFGLDFKGFLMSRQRKTNKMNQIAMFFVRDWCFTDNYMIKLLFFFIFNVTINPFDVPHKNNSHYMCVPNSKERTPMN